ncbi:hypothetical protein EHN06_20100 [Marinobacter sp. NP-4(2019)]|uniref:hypothetical protein n=1 Tax=Marinobacter sp. NP-4(2019) TaxID=2488665 RepID=UPI000FC3D698|nr:hypothetical protein [Marinobacter sp. NP-4(2019)]AZT85667.1 hypothetical protein EHN06_20100 [Marinobacter sp. NP-4(2019)]
MNILNEALTPFPVSTLPTKALEASSPMTSAKGNVIKVIQDKAAQSLSSLQFGADKLTDQMSEINHANTPTIAKLNSRPITMTQKLIALYFGFRRFHFSSSARIFSNP